MSGEEATRYLALVLLALLVGFPLAGALPMASVGIAGNTTDTPPRQPTAPACETESAGDAHARSANSRPSPRRGRGMTAAMANVATTRLHYDVWVRVVGRNTTRYQDTFTASTDATLSLFRFLADPGLDTASVESVDPVAVDIQREAAEGSTTFSHTPDPELESAADTTRDGGTLTLRIEGPKGIRVVVWNSAAVRGQCHG